MGVLVGSILCPPSYSSRTAKYSWRILHFHMLKVYLFSVHAKILLAYLEMTSYIGNYSRIVVFSLYAKKLLAYSQKTIKYLRRILRLQQNTFCLSSKFEYRLQSKEYAETILHFRQFLITSFVNG